MGYEREQDQIFRQKQEEKKLQAEFDRRLIAAVRNPKVVAALRKQMETIYDGMLYKNGD